MFGEVPERSKGPDCKSGGSAFEGSNPSLTTTSPREKLEREKFYIEVYLVNSFCFVRILFEETCLKINWRE